MRKFIDDDFVNLRRAPDSSSEVRVQLAFGDEVELLETQGEWQRMRALSLFDGQASGWANNSPKLKFRDSGIVKFSTVDVQQGDGMILETPSGKIVLIDGGDNKLFARHLAARFLHRGASVGDPLSVEAIITTHGDADHFDGLNDIKRSETESGIAERKRVFLHPKRIYHNGLVKFPSTKSGGGQRSDLEMFGPTEEKDGTPYAVDLHDDPSALPDERLNRPFESWANTIQHWRTRGAIDVKRIAFGDDESNLFDFLHAEGLSVELQGPFPETVNGKTGFRFFRAPSKSAEMHLKSEEGSFSASHTINGHSIAMRLTFGAVRFNLTGDINRPAMQLALANLDPKNLEAEIVKAPHHGSGDFDFKALKATRPVAAIISSGDESAVKEHIHPRATLMAALGKVMRGNTGLIFSTELAAFFTKRDYAHEREVLKKYFKDRETDQFTGAEIAKLFTGRLDAGDPEPDFFAFERTNFGIIHVRTDGERVLIFTHSGRRGVNEAYVFTVKKDAAGRRRIRFRDQATTR
ncbi:MAG: SH3 domain-containing protein [Proteobacteria bacterium]|nr:SH3 domain-containing protein [Pseudomonadota bacterium]